ncbi:Z-ring associated protein ZapG [Thaumasiovibrio subtropicus]|uniref:Z-ring associated protein ZapG n=1 Tax=Thaumasiovibrio subtropicus TaxID=1891207 RepID=UPI000B35F143|nr:Z-ring associated protein ZapG [Thaumasiovibrio subtropicus]
MTVINALLYFAGGIVVGALLTRLLSRKTKQQKDLQKDLDKTRYELEQYRQELVDHFAQSAGLLDNIAKDYSKLYQHMAKTSTELMPNLPAQDNPFAARISHLTPVENETPEAAEKEEPQPEEAPEEEVIAQAPKDYSDEATGLLSGETSQEKRDEPEAPKEKVS